MYFISEMSFLFSRNPWSAFVCGCRLHQVLQRSAQRTSSDVSGRQSQERDGKDVLSALRLTSCLSLSLMSL